MAAPNTDGKNHIRLVYSSARNEVEQLTEELLDALIEMRTLVNRHADFGIRLFS